MNFYNFDTNIWENKALNKSIWISNIQEGSWITNSVNSRSRKNGESAAVSGEYRCPIDNGHSHNTATIGIGQYR